MTNRGSLVGAAAAALACALLVGLWLHCGSAPPEARAPSAPAPSATATSAPSAAAAPVAARPPPDAASAGATAGGRSAMDKVLSSLDEGELRLLAQIEKATGTAPPAEVHTVLRMAKDGATDEALRAYVQTHFGGQILVRRQLIDWIDRRRPAKAPATAPAPSGPRRIDALQKAAP